MTKNASAPCRTCGQPTGHVTQFCTEECFTEWQITGPRSDKARPDKVRTDTTPLHEALLAMGYREVKPGMWLKPVAYQSFGFEEKFNSWKCFFKQTDGCVAIWNSHTMRTPSEDVSSYIDQLKMFEYDTRTNIFNMNSTFELAGTDYGL